MYSYIKETYNITPESKLLIGLGDSFTEGQGALSDTTWGKYNHDTEVRTQELHMDELEEELSNSWVHQICKNHMPEYTPVNFGFRGKGNKNSFKNLTTFNKDLKIESAQEIIVVAHLTDMMRYDYLNHHHLNKYEHNYYTTMWPHEPAEKDEEWKKKLWGGYRDGLWSDSFGCVEFLINMQDLKNWCKLNNAKLLLTSAFSQEYTRDFFIHNLMHSHYTDLVDIIDWENEFYYPDGYNCFTDLLCEREGRKDWIGTQEWYWYSQKNGGTDNGWFTPCAHPSIKGHALIAEKIFHHINSKGWVNGPKRPLI